MRMLFRTNKSRLIIVIPMIVVLLLSMFLFMFKISGEVFTDRQFAASDTNDNEQGHTMSSDGILSLTWLSMVFAGQLLKSYAGVDIRPISNLRYIKSNDTQMLTSDGSLFISQFTDRTNLYLSKQLFLMRISRLKAG